jgi:hypothetical protein
MNQRRKAPPQRRQVLLTEEQRQDLLRLRDTAPKPYLRERAAAILKIAEGTSAASVARNGLLRARKPDTVYAWLDRYMAYGVEGLTVSPGRGRKSSQPKLAESQHEFGAGMPFSSDRTNSKRT